MIKRARTPAPIQAVTEEAPTWKRPTPKHRVSLKATQSHEGTAVRATPHKKPDTDDGSAKPHEKPNLKLEYALKRIRGNVEHARNGVREKLYVAYAECCALAHCLKHNRSEWEEFCKLPFWNQRGKIKPELKIDDALRLILISTVYGLSRSQQKTASKVSIALKAYTDSAYDTQDIVSLIQKKGGIAELARQEAAPKPAKKPQTSEDESPPTQETKVNLMGVPLARILKHKLNTKLRIEVMVTKDANGKKTLKCLSFHRI